MKSFEKGELLVKRAEQVLETVLIAASVFVIGAGIGLG